MNKSVNKGHRQSTDSSISTTGTTTASPHFTDTIENNVKYINLNFDDNSESSSQPKDAITEYNKIQNSFHPTERVVKPPPSKILPTSLALSSMKTDGLKSKDESQLKEKSLLEMGFNVNEAEGWEQIVQPPKENLYKLLRNMIDNHIKPNVQIRIGGVTFNCHMMVLQCYSDFFMDCNNEVLIQLPEEKITPEAFLMVYDWMLAEEPLVQREGILELFNAANFLRIKDLINQCWLCLDDDVGFREDTAFLLYLEARNYGLDILEQLMLMRICKFFLTLVASKEFLSLNAKEMCSLLSSNTIGVNSEIEIFMSVVRWMSHNWEERESHLLDVVKCVRFGLMPPWFLVSLTKNTDCKEIDRIVADREVRKIIDDAISYTTTQLCYGENRDEFLHFLERYQLVAPMQRQWVFDKECSYHHRLECPNMEFVTYKSFLDYLEMIRGIGKDYWRSLEMAEGVEKPMQCCSRADGRKSIHPNAVRLCPRKSHDRGIQCESDNRSPKVREIKGGGKINFTHRKRSNNSMRRIPSGHPKYVPSIITMQQCKRNDNATETDIERLMNFKYPHGNDAKDTSSTPQQQEYRPQPENILYDNEMHHTTDMKGHIINCPTSILQPPPLTSPLPPVVIHGVSSDVMARNQQRQQHQQHLQLLSTNPPQQMRQNHSTTTTATGTNASCPVIYKRDDIGAAVTMADVSGDTLAGQYILNNNDILTKNNDGGGDNVAKKPVDKGALVEWKLNSTCPVDIKRIPNRRILIFGGIDPYCLDCQHEQQHQQFSQHQTKQCKRMFPQDASHQGVSKTTSTATNPSIGTAIINDINCSSAPVNNKFENFGDQVLVNDVNDDDNAMEWRHLSHIPFGSRHHHAVAVCNGLIYLIGGTRTALGCAKKSVFEKSVWCFDPHTLKWTLESSLPESRRDFAVVAIDRRKCDRCKCTKNRDEHETGFYVIGGEGKNGIALKTVWFYSVGRKLWIKKPSLNIGRYGLAAAMVNNQIWIAGGITNGGHGCSRADVKGVAGGGGGGGGDGVGESFGASNDDSAVKSSTAHVITDTMEIYTLKCSHEILAYNAEEGFQNVYIGANRDPAAATAVTTKAVASNDDDAGAGNPGCCDDVVMSETGAIGEMCDCNVGQWIKSKLHLRVPRLFGKFCKMSNGDLYLVGGIGAKNNGGLTSLPDIDHFQVKQQQWQHCGDLNWPRHGHDVGSLNDHCFVVVGGVSIVEKRSLQQVEAFCTKTRNCLKDLPDLPWPLSGCAVVTL